MTQISIPGGAYDDRVVEIAKRAGYEKVLNSVEGYNEESPAFVLRRFTPRAYTGVPALEAICEHPARTAARLTIKRAVLRVARGVMGGSGYGRLRAALISRRQGEAEDTSRR